jgi:hypothetical protein
LNSPGNEAPCPFTGIWKQSDKAKGINNIIQIDSPYVLGSLASESPECPMLCPSLSFQIDGTWYNDLHFFYYIDGNKDTTVIEYRFDENGNYLYMHGISSGLTRWYTFFDSLYLSKSDK